MPAEPAPRSLLIKPVSGDCNLHCAYCFYHDRPSDPYREQTRHRMSDAVLEELIRQGMRLDPRQAVFGWQGGEPTLAGLSFFQRVVELQQKHGSPGQVVSNGMQTNGLLLDAEWARLLRRYNFLLGVSLDGPTDFHDHYRTYAHGAPTQEKVLEATRLLRRYQVEFNVLTVVNRLTAAHGAEVFDYLVAQGYDYLQFIPCVERDPESGALTPFSLQAEQFGDFLCAVFDRWYNGGRPQVSVRDFEAILAVYLGQEAPLCCYQKQCASYLVVEYNGDIYPCDFYVDQAHYIGNIARMSLEEAFQSEPVRRFAAAKATPRPECQVCAWLPYCHQGCPRFLSVDGPRHYLCRAYQRFFAHSQAGFMALRERLLRERGDDPARLPTSPEHVPGRNDPCPCGSGKKFKQCCGRKGKTT